MSVTVWTEVWITVTVSLEALAPAAPELEALEADAVPYAADAVTV